MSRRSAVAPALALALALTPAGRPLRAADAPTPLFDGKTLDGWVKVGGGATYRVEDGCIVGEVGPGANTFLRTRKTYGDFRLELDVRLDVPGNSGVQFRSHQKPGENGRVFGYQCEIDPSPRAWSGGIYDEGRRGWLAPLTGKPGAQKAFKLDGWNHLVIEAFGPRLRTTVNGVPCADLVDTVDDDGFIALQVHAGKAGRIRWKNIVLHGGATSWYQPLFNGKDLTGWKPDGGGHWAVEGGAIRGTHAKDDPRHGHLFSKDLNPFVSLRMKVKPVKGDSGVYVHARPGGKSGITGLQANVDPEKDTGGLYEIDGRGWLTRPKPDDIKKWLKPGEWNDLAVVVVGGREKAYRVVVQVNGHTTADVETDLPGEVTPAALQLHAGQDVDVWYRDVVALQIGPNGEQY